MPDLNKRTSVLGVRVTQSTLDDIRARAEAERRSVATLAGMLIEEGLDEPRTPLRGPEQPPAPVVPRRPGKRLIFGSPKTADLVYSAIEDALDEHGMDIADGRRTVTTDKVLADFEVKRREFSKKQKKPEDLKQLNADGYRIAMKLLLDVGAVCGDPNVMVWLPA